jgi:hypothetical protein
MNKKSFTDKLVDSCNSDYWNYKCPYCKALLIKIENYKSCTEKDPGPWFECLKKRRSDCINSWWSESYMEERINDFT